MTIICPQCSAELKSIPDGTTPWHTYPFNSREVCMAADRGTLIRTLRSAGIDVEEADDYLILPNNVVIDPYTGRWWFGLADLRMEGGCIHAGLPLNERVLYLRDLCFPCRMEESAA